MTLCGFESKFQSFLPYEKSQSFIIFISDWIFEKMESFFLLRTPVFSVILVFILFLSATSLYELIIRADREDYGYTTVEPDYGAKC